MSQAVAFTYQPAVAETYSVTVSAANSLSGSFTVNQGQNWPGWSPDWVVFEVIVTPKIVYLGESATIEVDMQGPPSPPAKYPMTIEGTITVDGTTLSKSYTAEFSNPGLIFTYTPTKTGTFTITAQDKTATFQVLANPTGTYYSPYGGTRIPLCTDILFPNVAAFTYKLFGYATFTWPGGDLKWSQIWQAFALFPNWKPASIFAFSLKMGGVPANIPQLNAAIPNAVPCACEPAGATISNWVKAILPFTYQNYTAIVMMATDYNCQPYWDSKDELAAMIADFLGKNWSTGETYGGTSLIPSAWTAQYSVTCPVCGGTGTLTGRSGRTQKCLLCNGTGRVWEIDLGTGLRDWSGATEVQKARGLMYIIDYYSYTYTTKMWCPYCGGGVCGTYSTDPGRQGELDAARWLLKHIETVHPDHPLTEPARF